MDLLDTIPWVEKYRPTELSHIVSQSNIIETIKRYIHHSQLPHLLFHGPPGTGKTTTINAVAKLLYGPKLRAFVLELNASDDRGIATVREQIKTFSESKSSFGLNEASLDYEESKEKENIATLGAEKMGGEPLNSMYKLIILDEADQMTSPAQNSLRRIMEQYSRNVRFCIICNHINKINPAIQSRCTGFRFAPLPEAEVAKRMWEIAAAEKVNITEDGMSALLSVGKGDMRRALNCFQIAGMSNRNVALTESLIHATLGLPNSKEIDMMLSLLMEFPFEKAYNELLLLQKIKGFSLQTLINALYNRILFVQLPNTVVIQLMIRLGDIEEHLSSGTSNEIQLAALVSSFVNVRYDLQQLKI